MRGILALIRVSWLTHTSYRMNVVFSVLGLVALFIPVYLVSGALQPVVANSIQNEGGVYFGFLIAGLAVTQVANVAARGLPNSVSGGISSGTLEALFATPTPLPQLLVGMMGYDLLWAVVRATLLVVGFLIVGGSLAFAGLPLAAVILVLLVVAYSSVGIVAASMILVFRTSGPFVPGVLSAFSLLGGVYYSTSVIPSVVRPLAAFVPLTYGLRAFRKTLLSGDPFSAVARDISMLAVLAFVLLGASLLIFVWSLRYARRAGSLAQY
jgi:ABC-2 type transport system permease protein